MSIDKKTNLNVITEQDTLKINKIVESLNKTIDEVGQIKALNWVSKLATVASLQKIQIIKENKAYIGIPYLDNNGIWQRVASWDDFCVYKLFSSRRTVDNDLLNLRELGEDFFEFSKQVNLGDRELRKIRQLSQTERTLVLESEAVKNGDIEAIKEQLEDLTVLREKEKAEMTKELDEVKRDLAITLDVSMEKQQKLDDIAERKAKRLFDQEPWEQDVLDSFEGLTLAGNTIVQGVNQIKNIFEKLVSVESEQLDQKSIDYIRKGIFFKIKECNEYFNDNLDVALSVLGKMPDDINFDCTEFFLKKEYPKLFENNGDE